MCLRPRQRCGAAWACGRPRRRCKIVGEGKISSVRRIHVHARAVVMAQRQNLRERIDATGRRWIVAAIDDPRASSSERLRAGMAAAGVERVEYAATPAEAQTQR